MSQKVDKLDLAARAGWLYYVAGCTQEEIASQFGISRQSAQRMVSLSVSEKLIKVRLDHPLSDCMKLAEQLKEKYSLKECEVIPAVSKDVSTNVGLGQAGAAMMEKYIESNEPLIIGLGTGRVLNMIANELSPTNGSHHRLLSLVGNMANDGSASSQEVVSKIADKINATYYPMPLPLIVSTKEEKELLHNQQSTKNVLALGKKVDISFVGIGQIDDSAPMYKDNFINRRELDSLLKNNAVGEIIGWAFDKDGNILKGDTNSRLTSIPLAKDSQKLVIGIAAVKPKFAAIKAALKGKLINGLITNEVCAKALLEE
ncbi:MAG: sugar-binding transcriptional regulator [Poseidonibacter sp.]